METPEKRGRGKRIPNWHPKRVEAEVETERVNRQLSDTVADILKMKGWTQAQLGKEMGVSPNYVSNVLNRAQQTELRTFSWFLVALGYRIRVYVEPISPDPTSSPEPSSLPQESASPSSPSAEGPGES